MKILRSVILIVGFSIVFASCLETTKEIKVVDEKYHGKWTWHYYKTNDYVDHIYFNLCNDTIILSEAHTYNKTINNVWTEDTDLLTSFNKGYSYKMGTFIEDDIFRAKHQTPVSNSVYKKTSDCIICIE